jgi:hypothetical protein
MVFWKCLHFGSELDNTPSGTVIDLLFSMSKLVWRLGEALTDKMDKNT